MTIQERAINSVVVLDLIGRLCLDDGDQLFKETVQRVMKGGCRHVIVNLTHVSYADSAGLGALLSVFLDAKKQGGHLRLHSPAQRLQDLLVMTRLRAVLEISDSESQAFASLENLA
jgi:anti-anti-sigma factor